MGNSILVQMNTGCNVKKRSIKSYTQKKKTHPYLTELLMLLLAYRYIVSKLRGSIGLNINGKPH